MGQITIDDLIEQNHIRATIQPIPRRTDGTEWNNPGSRHYRVTITSNRESMTVEYSMGSAIKAHPTLREVLWSLAMDCSTIDDYQNNLAGFLAWANDFGMADRGNEYRAEQAWESIHQTERHLRRLRLTALIDGTVDTSDE